MTDTEITQYRADSDVRCARMAELKQLIKDRKFRVSEIAYSCGCSPSNIYSILRGNWPYYGAGRCPLYFERWVKSRLPDFSLQETKT